ncbi:MAG: putative Ig domain-containing protein [Bacteroidota bacterium]
MRSFSNQIILFFFLLVGTQLCFAQNKAEFTVKNNWVESIFEIKNTDQPVDKNLSKQKDIELWQFLRKNFNRTKDLQEMSWEERDKIWDFQDDSFSLKKLGQNYMKALNVSYNERGIKPVVFQNEFKTLADVYKLREIYLQSRAKEYVILTPKPLLSPKINGPSIFGARPGHPILYKVPVTGQQPLKITISGLPEGCKFNEKTGIITGALQNAGTYKLIINASNIYGKDLKTFILKIGSEISLTPPMGWNSWNCFASDVTAKDIQAAAESMVSSGLANYGWSYINIDDCWMNRPAEDDPIFKINDIITEKFVSKENLRKRLSRIRFNESKLVGNVRDKNGNILSNIDFPDMKGLTNKIHDLGLKTGIYISPGHVTCQNYIGSLYHEEQDAKQFAEWGFDYLKYDWCGYSQIVFDNKLETLKKPYLVMRDALNKVDRDIIYSICQYGKGEVWEWGKEVGGNLWRTTSDIRDTWESITKLGFGSNGKEAYAGPGHWNDPDMLVVGYVGWSKNLRPTYLSPNEQYTHVSLWSLLSAPLIIGADLTKLDDFTLGLLSNSEVLAVDQDMLGKQAKKVLDSNNIQVWQKELADGSFAIGIFNTGEVPADYKLELNAINLKGNYTVRDLWLQKDLKENVSQFSSTINRHGVKLLKLTPVL